MEVLEQHEIMILVDEIHNPTFYKKKCMALTNCKNKESRNLFIFSLYELKTLVPSLGRYCQSNSLIFTGSRYG